jgi:hypothetical protein
MIQDIQEYLKTVNSKSKFETQLNDKLGYFIGKNSGKGGERKTFSYGIDAFKQTLQDILNNHEKFKGLENYNEDNWRKYGPQYFTNSEINSSITVQTKLLLTSLSKLINWATEKAPGNFSDKNIDLKQESLSVTIAKLGNLENLFLPTRMSSDSKISKTTVLLEKDLNHFAFKTFKLLLEKYGYNKIANGISEKEATINESEYIALMMKPYFGSANLIGVFDQPQSKESLKSGTSYRYFEEKLNFDNHQNAYFTTQWADIDKDKMLSLKSLQNFVQDITGGNFVALKNGDRYTLMQNEIKVQKIIQKIFYGAPGTGKSYKIEEILSKIESAQKERVTFHPEFDYASFVGGYKPSTEKNNDETEDIKYKFVPQIFTNIYVDAWKNPYKEYYLAIEEINRGNCAEIFGDLFQLLDRTSNYSISPSKELREYLVKTLADENSKKGIEGNKMKLPPNLHLLASMNTSDQSLFPMDSAFKRRWAWEYVPICYKEFNEDDEKTANKSFHFEVQLDEMNSFRWIEFIDKINQIIKSNRNLGTDKCIGNYFINPHENIISLEEFINKAMFYLWIDVFKDEEESVFDKLEKDMSYEDFFPIKTKGKDAVIKLLTEVLEVDIKTVGTSEKNPSEVES